MGSEATKCRILEYCRVPIGRIDIGRWYVLCIYFFLIDYILLFIITTFDLVFWWNRRSSTCFCFRFCLFYWIFTRSIYSIQFRVVGIESGIEPIDFIKVRTGFVLTLRIDVNEEKTLFLTSKCAPNIVKFIFTAAEVRQKWTAKSKIYSHAFT